MSPYFSTIPVLLLINPFVQLQNAHVFDAAIFKHPGCSYPHKSYCLGRNLGGHLNAVSQSRFRSWKDRLP